MVEEITLEHSIDFRKELISQETLQKCLQVRTFHNGTKLIASRPQPVVRCSARETFTQGTLVIQRRSFIQMFDAIYNGIDYDRLEKVGPDRTCAEWLMRCGARVRFKGHSEFIDEFNSLPLSNFDKDKIEEIDFTGSTAMDTGFQHLKNLKHVKRIVFNNGKYITSFCIANLIEVKDTLEELEIINCDQIPATGLHPLVQLQKLRKLVLCNLPLIKEEQRKSLVDILQEQLPKCQVEFLQKRQKLS